MYNSSFVSDEEQQRKIQEAVKEAVAEQLLKLNVKYEPEPISKAPVRQEATPPSYPVQQYNFSPP